MRVIKFAWHLFWAARRCPGEPLPELIQVACQAYARHKPWDFVWTDTDFTEALRRYGR